MIIKSVLFIIFVSIPLFAELTQTDTEFFNYSNKYISQKVPSNYKDALNGDFNDKLNNMLQNDQLSFDKYKKDLSESFEEAFDQVGIKELSDTIDHYKSIYTSATDKLESIKKEITSLYKNTSIKGMTKLIDKNWTVEVFDKDGEETTITIMDSEMLENKANTMDTAKQNTINGFSCLCEGVLQQAFKKIDQHINMKNLNEIVKEQKNLIANVDNNIKELDNQVIMKKNSNLLLKENIAQLNLYLLNLKKRWKSKQ